MDDQVNYPLGIEWHELIERIAELDRKDLPRPFTEPLLNDLFIAAIEQAQSARHAEKQHHKITGKLLIALDALNEIKDQMPTGAYFKVNQVINKAIQDIDYDGLPPGLFRMPDWNCRCQVEPTEPPEEAGRETFIHLPPPEKEGKALPGQQLQRLVIEMQKILDRDRIIHPEQWDTTHLEYLQESLKETAGTFAKMDLHGSEKSAYAFAGRVALFALRIAMRAEFINRKEQKENDE